MNKFEQQIFDYLAKPGYKPRTAAALAKKLKLSKKLLPKHQAALARLIESGKVHQSKKGLLRLRSAPGMVVGIIKRIGSGAGYLIPHEPPPDPRAGDIFIASEDLRDAHTGDEVLVCLLKRRRSRGQRCGRVEEILERATNTFVGTYFEQSGQGCVKVDGKTFTEPIFVDDPGAKTAQPGDKVVVEMLRFPSHYRAGEAVLTEVLGARGKPGVDTLSIIHEFGLPHEFSEKVLAEARLLAEEFDETRLDDRRDLTGETIVTIDPADARDFDDAISLTRSQNGEWHLGVHIADVSHFVRPGSTLDMDARKRGNSVYLPRHVLPMLPEVISNGLASLQKGKLRFTKSVFIEFTAEGVPVHTEFVNSAIKVTRRLAYPEVMPIVQQPEKYKTRVSTKVRALLARMHELAMILRSRRFESGALELNLPEVKIDFDRQGRVVGAHEVEHDESHQIIEEFMLAANIAVATALADRGIAFLRRVHADPEITKLRAFAEFSAALGYPLSRHQSRPQLQALLSRVRGKPHQDALNYALLRSLKQAEYAAIEMGHYALSVENYCHFTSPIRRYPDLMVHRLIDRLLTSKRLPKGPNALELAKLAKHCSMSERRAADAERELTTVKLLTYMAGRIGDELEAIVTGVEQFGIFCRGVDIPVEGLVHISALEGDDSFYHDPATFSLIGRRSGRQYRLGDRIRVIVAHVDIDRRELDFRTSPQSGRRKKSGSRKKSAPKTGSKSSGSRRRSKEPMSRRPRRGKKKSRRKKRR